MRPASFRFASLIALALVLAAVLAPAPASAERRAKHVVLVDWDGFDHDYLARADLPSLRRLARRGSLTVASSTFHTVSNPARASILSSRALDSLSAA